MGRTTTGGRNGGVRGNPKEQNIISIDHVDGPESGRFSGSSSVGRSQVLWVLGWTEIGFEWA